MAIEGWQQLDSINLTSTFHRLAQLAEGSPAGAAAVRAEVQACGGVWAWLLDCLAAAASQDPEFGPRCAANALWALHKLDALDCARLEALRAPLARALAATVAGRGTLATRLSARGLTQVLGVLGADSATLPLLAALKPQLLQALWVAAPTLDAQVGAGQGSWLGALRMLLLNCSPACSPALLLLWNCYTLCVLFTPCHRPCPQPGMRWAALLFAAALMRCSWVQMRRSCCPAWRRRHGRRHPA